MSDDMIPIKYGKNKIAEIHEISLRCNFCYGALITLESQVITEDELRKVLKQISTHRRKIKKATSKPSSGNSEESK